MVLVRWFQFVVFWKYKNAKIPFLLDIGEELLKDLPTTSEMTRDDWFIL